MLKALSTAHALRSSSPVAFICLFPHTADVRQSRHAFTCLISFEFLWAQAVTYMVSVLQIMLVLTQKNARPDIPPIESLPGQPLPSVDEYLQLMQVPRVHNFAIQTSIANSLERCYAVFELHPLQTHAQENCG